MLYLLLGRWQDAISAIRSHGSDHALFAESRLFLLVVPLCLYGQQ
jgi:hypothetical protein